MEAAMALLDDILNGGSLTTGLVVGAGVLIAWPLVGTIAWPLARGLINGGLVAYREGERLFSAVVEAVGDICCGSPRGIDRDQPQQRRRAARKLSVTWVGIVTDFRIALNDTRT